jgi:tRNA(fMet)-specific endonuclease VapC
MKVMLDTNVCSSLIGKKSQARIAWAVAHRPGELGISVITLCELEYGVANSSNPARNGQALLMFLSPIEIADYSSQVASVYGRVRFALKHAQIGPMDLLLASHALTLDVEFATDNIKEFGRVPGLKLAQMP